MDTSMRGYPMVEDYPVSAIAAEYLVKVGIEDGPVADVIRALRTGVRPEDVTEAIPPDLTEGARRAAASFLLFLIRRGVADHALTEQETSVIRHLQRVLRIEEGDLLTLYPHDVRAVLYEEMTTLLRDHHVDPVEAIHKVKLQELLGLGYDQFLELTTPEIGSVIVNLAERIDMAQPGALAEFRQRVAALDTYFNLNTSAGIKSGGYIYLLANPAMPGIVKVGKTTQPPAERAAELSAATGTPIPFELVYYVFAEDCIDAERRTHEWLTTRGYRVADSQEFYRAPIPDVISWMISLADSSVSRRPEPGCEEQENQMANSPSSRSQHRALPRNGK